MVGDSGLITPELGIVTPESFTPAENNLIENVRGRRIVTEMPTISAEWLFGPAVDANPYRTRRKNILTLDLTDSYIVGLAGPRGGGKSLGLAFVGIKALALGLPVWSNFPIRFNFTPYSGADVILESSPLYFKDIFAMSPDLRGGIILIDEYQDWANALSVMSHQNKLLNSFWAQIRKNLLSFYFAAKKLRWIDIKTREETDVNIICQDDYFTAKNRHKRRRGDVIYWNCLDLSGMWTGKAYDSHPVTHSFRLYCRPIMGSFNTNERFDIFEAMRGIKVDLRKTLITDKEDGPGYSLEDIEARVNEIFKAVDKVRPSELWGALGIKNSLIQGEIRPLLFEMGIEEKLTRGSKYYVKKAVENKE